MQKIKKALKKLAISNLRSKPALAAKKATPVKKKTQALPSKAAAKKAAPKKAAAPAKKVAAKPAPAKAKVAPKGKPVAKDAKKKVAAAPAPKATAKAAAPAPKATAKAAPAKAAAPAAKAAKAPASKETKETKAKSKAVEAEIETAPAQEKAPKAAKAPKARKGREEVVEAEPEEEVILLDADGRRYCRVKDCDQGSTVDGYCRFHYLLFWKNIQNRKSILAEGKLERYIEELTARYPDKYLDMLRKDLRSEKEFLAAIQELEIDEAAVDNEYEDEAQNYLDEVRGMGTDTGGGAERDDEF